MLEEARRWVEIFVGWYNEEHSHSGIRYVTPGQRHRGEDSKLLAERKSVIPEYAATLPPQSMPRGYSLNRW